MMNPSSSKVVPKVEQEVQRKTRKPQWLAAFLRRTFFDSCSDHPIRRNEMNRYCINCDFAACQYCMPSGTHRNHKLLKIYRHVYKDVVSLGSMEKHLDCSGIQPYKCNKRLVISLHPLPHNGPTANREISCEICKRRLAEPDLYRYCSISCKVTAFERKASDSVLPFLTNEHSPIPERRRRSVQHPAEKRRNRRKGIPRRAPFF